MKEPNTQKMQQILLLAATYIKRMSNYDTIAATYKNYANKEDWQQRMLGRNLLSDDT